MVIEYQIDPHDNLCLLYFGLPIRIKVEQSNLAGAAPAAPYVCLNAWP